MKNKYNASVDRTEEIRYFFVNKIIKNYAVAFIAIIIIGYIILTGAAIFFNMKIKEYNKLIQEKAEQYDSLMAENLALYNDLEDSKKQFENINEKIIKIEELINDDIYTSDEPMTQEEKLEILKADLEKKKYLLTIIPNGDPIFPFNGYTSGFGKRTHPILDKTLFHYGLDYRADIGTSVIAPADGVIEYAGYNSGGFGKLIIVSHSFGFKTYYAHLNKINVKQGDFILKGDKIGETGNTGRSSGPHLHYEIHYLGRRLNPKNFASWSLENYDDIFDKEKNVKWQYLAEAINHQTQIFQKTE